MQHNKNNKGTQTSRKSGKNKASMRNRSRRLLPMCYVPPQSKRVTLVFASSFSFAEAAVGTGAFNFYRLNSVYDVDTSLGSTSTPGLNEWSAFFSNYRVWAARVRIEATVNNLSTGGTATFSMVPNPLQATLPSSASSWPVQYGAVHKTITNVTSGGTNLVVLDKQYQLHKVFRITPQQFKDDFDFTAATTANPARQAYLAVAVKSNNSTTTAGAGGQIYVSFDVEFFNNILLAT
jgi:hypothetical protein